MPGFARAHRSLPATAGAMLASALLATAAVAQSYPTAPVRVIVPFNAGGATDVLAREMPAQALTLALANEALARFKQMSG